MREYIRKSGLCETDLHPFTLKKIYQTVVMPRGLYGCEFWQDLSNSQLIHLERSFGSVLKLCKALIAAHDRALL